MNLNYWFLYTFVYKKHSKFNENTMKVKTLLCIMVLLSTLVSCRSIREVRRLTKCEFKLGSLEKPVLAGIKVYEKESFSDLGLKDVALITASVSKGELPLEFILNIDVKNPNKKMAAINKIEWIIYIDEIEVCAGILEERIEVPPNDGTATIPLHIKTNLKEVTTFKSAKSLVNFGLNLADASNKPTRVSLKIKPSIRIGNKQISSPGFIKVKKEFSSE